MGGSAQQCSSGGSRGEEFCNLDYLNSVFEHVIKKLRLGAPTGLACKKRAQESHQRLLGAQKLFIVSFSSSGREV